MTREKQVKQPKASNPLVDDLISWGLTKAEAEIYLCLLQKSEEIGGSKIAGGTGIHRQYVYIALESLIKKSLVETISVGKYKKYKAKPANEIEKITRKRSLEASNLAYELNKISAIHNDQDFEVLQGANAIRQQEMNYVYECPQESEEFIIGGNSNGFINLMGDSLDEYLHEKNKKKIKVCYLGSENEKVLYKKHIGVFPFQQYRFAKDLPTGVTHMVIRKDTVLFFSFLTPPLVYIIKSPVVAENYKQFFMMVWNMVEE